MSRKKPRTKVVWECFPEGTCDGLICLIATNGHEGEEKFPPKLCPWDCKFPARWRRANVVRGKAEAEGSGKGLPAEAA